MDFAAKALFIILATLASLAASDKALASDQIKHLRNNAHQISQWIIGHRRELHKIPETAFEELKTSQYLRNVLDELSVKYEYPVAKTGIVADIGTGKQPIVLLRADIDGLPIQEPRGLPYASQHQNKMHACGHDTHMAMLLGAVKLLKQLHDSRGLNGTARILFQPAEEIVAGAEKCVEAGVMQGVSAAFGLHIWPQLPSGQIGTKAGPITCAATYFKITIKGKGGHAAQPENVIDPIVAGSAVISALQSIVAREIAPIDSAALSITFVNAGSALNVIPETYEFGGTVRASSSKIVQYMEERVVAVAQAVAKTYRCSAEIQIPYGTSRTIATINNEQGNQIVQNAGEQIFGLENVISMPLQMIGEDFGVLSTIAPSVFALLGTRNESIGATFGLHHPNIKIDEHVLHLGAAIHAGFVLEQHEYLSREKKQASEQTLQVEL